ncbi:MAG: hypothetical protein ACC661_08710, partial [Verrucomicrobiales bacterium]
SILHSHAFDSQHPMRALYNKSGAKPVKDNIKCLFWKESLRISNLIRSREIDLDAIFRQDERLRFLLPVRNPLDCAISNMRSGHISLFDGLERNATQIEAARAVLDEIFWCAALRKRHPKRVFIFMEDGVSKQMLSGLARFLRLAPDRDWIASALSAMRTRPAYRHDPALLHFCVHHVADRADDFPHLCKGLIMLMVGRSALQR